MLLLWRQHTSFNILNNENNYYHNFAVIFK